MGIKIKLMKSTLAVAAVVLIGFTIVILGCSDGVTTGAVETPDPFLDEDVPPYCVWGYVYDGANPMSGALVEVYCASDQEILGEAQGYTTASGYYEVGLGEETWEEHVNCWCVSHTPDYSSAFYKLSEAGSPPYRLGPKNIYYP